MGSRGAGGGTGDTCSGLSWTEIENPARPSDSGGILEKGVLSLRFTLSKDK